MPSVDVAMARSLQGGVWGTLRNAVVRSVAADLARRGIIDNAQDTVSDVATAFSSWDNCMKADFCKWPVIAVIVIGGLIIFSIIWCIIRCCCCGLSCCCSCFECFKCCGNCCGCCDPPGGKKTKHLDDPYAPAPQHGYRTEPPMQPSISPFAPQANHAGPPQYAEFEMQKQRNDDALPEMPSWDSSNNKKVVVEHEAVELSDIKKPPHSDQQQNGVMNVTPPAQTGPTGGRSPYDQPQNSQSGYLASNQVPDHYSPIDQGYGYNNSNNGGANGFGMDQPYAAGVMGTAAGVGRSSPAQNYNGYGQDSYNQAPVELGSGQQHSSNNEYGGYDGYRGPSPGAPLYGSDMRTRQSPAPVPGPRRTPAPHQDPYGYGQSSRRTPAPLNDYSYGQSNLDRAFSPAPDRQYGVASPRPQARPLPQRHYGDEPPQSPITNNSGFDFNSGYARPQQSPTQDAYPGYKPYQPS